MALQQVCSKLEYAQRSAMKINWPWPGSVKATAMQPLKNQGWWHTSSQAKS